MDLQSRIRAVNDDGRDLLQPWKDWCAFVPFPPPRMRFPLEQRSGDLVSVPEPGLHQSISTRACPARCVSGMGLERYSPLRPPMRIVRGALDPREGDERLSAKKRSEPAEGGQPNRGHKPSSDKTSRKQRSTDLGRALRTIYDDTLREAVPDDFADLIGKLS